MHNFQKIVNIYGVYATKAKLGKVVKAEVFLFIYIYIFFPSPSFPPNSTKFLSTDRALRRAKEGSMGAADF